MAKQVKRVALSSSVRRLPKGSKLVGAADPEQQMEVSVRIRANRATSLTDNALMALGALQPGKRQYVSREGFAALAGADPADGARIDDFAHQHDLTVKSVPPPEIGVSCAVKKTASVKFAIAIK